MLISSIVVPTHQQLVLFLNCRPVLLCNDTRLADDMHDQYRHLVNVHPGALVTLYRVTTYCWNKSLRPFSITHTLKTNQPEVTLCAPLH